MSGLPGELFARGVARYGDLGLEASLFAVRARSDSTAYAEDLYLATACAANLEAAWSCFEANYRALVDHWCRRYTRTRHESLDLADQVWTSLFLPSRAGRPRIGSYEAQCSLATWLHTIVVRRAINEWRRRDNLIDRVEGTPDVPDCRSCARPDQDWQIHRYARAMQYSLRVACQRLSPQDCALLTWRFGRDMPLGEIALRLGVHSSTVTRRIDRICDRLRSEMIAVMSGDLRWNRAAIDECVRFAAGGELSEFSLLPSLEVRAAQIQTA